MTITAQRLRDEAAATDARVEESFQRCDTDGFLSQWAGGLTASLKRTQATLLDAGKVDWFPGLFEGDRRVAAKIIPTRFGSAWLLTDEEEARFGRKFVPTGTRSRVQKDLGLHTADEEAPAWACLRGEINVSVVVFRTDGGWPGAPTD